MHKNEVCFSLHSVITVDQNRGVPQCRETAMGSRSPAEPRRRGTATRISASLSRRLSAFFGSTHDQAPKAAKFAVLNPGHAGFPKRVERSEGSDTTPTQNATCFGVCAVVCDPVGKGECVPTFIRKSECGPFCRRLRQELFCRVVPIDGSRGWVFVTAFERPLKSV